MFKKSAVKSVSGYNDMLFFEDYYLWVKMIQKGCKMANLEDVHVYTYASDDIYKRRGGLEYLKYEIKFQKEISKLNYISKTKMMTNIVVRASIRILPNFIRKLVYKNILRKKQ